MPLKQGARVTAGPPASQSQWAGRQRLLAVFWEQMSTISVMEMALLFQSCRTLATREGAGQPVVFSVSSNGTLLGAREGGGFAVEPQLAIFCTYLGTFTSGLSVLIYKTGIKTSYPQYCMT